MIVIDCHKLGGGLEEKTAGCSRHVKIDQAHILFFSGSIQDFPPPSPPWPPGALHAVGLTDAQVSEGGGGVDPFHLRRDGAAEQNQGDRGESAARHGINGWVESIGFRHDGMLG